MKFTSTHDWISQESDHIYLVGISKFAKEQLGEVVYVELPKIGSCVKSGEHVVVLESTKAATDIYSPLSGKVVEVNKQLIDSPDLINIYPESQGWLFKLEATELNELDNLMNRNQYESLLNQM